MFPSAAWWSSSIAAIVAAAVPGFAATANFDVPVLVGTGNLLGASEFASAKYKGGGKQRTGVPLTGLRKPRYQDSYGRKYIGEISGVLWPYQVAHVVSVTVDGLKSSLRLVRAVESQG